MHDRDACEQEPEVTSPRTSLRLLAVLLLCLVVAHPQLVAQQERTRPRRQWENLFNLRPERKITVLLGNATRKKVRGKFVSVDPNGITVLTKDGQMQSFSRENVLKVTAERRKVKAAPWIGLVAGAATMAIHVQGPGVTDALAAIVIGVGAGVGAAAGLVVRMLMRNAVVYEAPKH